MNEAQQILFAPNLKVQVPSEKLQSGTSLYLAGPYGFAESTRGFFANIAKLITLMGGEVLDPWTLTDPQLIDSAVTLPYGIEKRDRWKYVNQVLGKNDENAIRKATGVIACLDGVDVDSGTAAEIGAAYMLGIPIIGYRGDFRLSTDNEGGTVNIMVQYFIENSAQGKGKIITSMKDLPAELLRVWGK
jgi:nucleoside 2-deoxyribosyltransferase